MVQCEGGWTHWITLGIQLVWCSRWCTEWVSGVWDEAVPGDEISLRLCRQDPAL